MAVTAIGQDDLAWRKDKAPEPLPAVGIGEFEIVADQIGQPQTVVQPPVGPGGARFLDVGGIDDAQHLALEGRQWRERTAGGGDQMVGERLQPRTRRAQAFVQGDGAHARPTAHLGAGHGLSQRESASGMHEDEPQPHRGILPARAAPHKAVLPCGALQIGRQISGQRLPILGKCIFIHARFPTVRPLRMQTFRSTAYGATPWAGLSSHRWCSLPAVAQST